MVAAPGDEFLSSALAGAADRLANDAVAGMQGLELPRSSLAASYLGTRELDRQGSLMQHLK